MNYATERIRVWGSDLDPNAIAQAEKTAALPVLLADAVVAGGEVLARSAWEREE